jgi:serine phosphatase RsbU (regulator of sigma subunit)
VIAIGDISGKGVAAALLMALVSSAIETLARNRLNPGELLTLLYAQLTPRLKVNRMNAAVLVVGFDLERRLLRVANAGMVAPLLLRQGRIEYLEAYGLPLGSLLQASYSEITVPLEHGDVLLLISDGVVEAHNLDHELFGFEGLEQTLAGYDPAMPLETLINDVISQVRQFSGEAEQHDDMTLVALRPAVAAREGA